MTIPRLVLGAALLDPSLAGFVCNALVQGSPFDDDILYVAVAVAALHERGDPGGVGWVAGYLGSWGWRHVEVARQLAVRTPEVLETMHDIRNYLEGLPPIDQEPIVVAARAILE